MLVVFLPSWAKTGNVATALEAILKKKHCQAIINMIQFVTVFAILLGKIMADANIDLSKDDQFCETEVSKILF